MSSNKGHWPSDLTVYVFYNIWQQIDPHLHWKSLNKMKDARGRKDVMGKSCYDEPGKDEGNWTQIVVLFMGVWMKFVQGRDTSSATQNSSPHISGDLNI